jgi:hypothetical protein
VGAHAIEQDVELAPRQVVLRGEVPEEGAPTDSGLPGDVVDGGLVEAAIMKSSSAVWLISACVVEGARPKRRRSWSESLGIP